MIAVLEYQRPFWIPMILLNLCTGVFQSPAALYHKAVVHQTCSHCVHHAYACIVPRSGYSLLLKDSKIIRVSGHLDCNGAPCILFETDWATLIS